MHADTEPMNSPLVHKHLLSVVEQPPWSAAAMHVEAHSVRLFHMLVMSTFVSACESRDRKIEHTGLGLAGDEGGGGGTSEGEDSEEAHVGGLVRKKRCWVIKKGR